MNTNDQATAFIKPLHGLRGLMALCVVAFHFSPSLGIGFFRLGSFGYAAVDVFFLMSGFVLARKHANEFRELLWSQIGAFLLQRWWRTYPLYLATVALTLGAMWVLHREVQSWQQLAVALLLLEGWALPGLGLNSPVWSLGVEWLGYLAFPMIAWACTRPITPLVRLLALGCLLCAEALLLTHLATGLAVDQGLASIIRMSAEFTAGCILATLPVSSQPPRRHNDIVMLSACIASITMLTFASIYSVPFLTLMVWGAVRPGPAVEAILSSRVMLYLGRISFALYLCHFPMLKIAEHLHQSFHVSPRIATLSGVLASFVIAHALCRYIEEPTLRWWRSRMHASAQPGAASPMLASSEPK